MSNFWQVEHHASNYPLQWPVAGLLFASFVMLFEFGRRLTLSYAPDLANKLYKHASIWLYAMLLLATLVMTKVANDPHLGFVIAIRFMVGFPAALMTGWVFLRESQLEQGGSHQAFPLLAAATFIIYGLSTIVMPAADSNFPALFMTQEQFMSFFYFPIQALRACCAVVAAISIVFIVRRLNYENALQEVRQMHRINQLLEVENINAILTKQAEERRQFEEQLRVMAVAFETQESVLITNAEGVILRVNQAFTKSTGYTAEEAVGQTPRMLKSGRHGTEFYREMWEILNHTGTWQGEVWDKRKNGEVYPKLLTISAVKNDDGVVTHYVGSHIDVTERRAAEDEIKNLAFYDTLTGLPNRRMLMDRLAHALLFNVRGGKNCSALFVDMDNFKTLNDTLGHAMGDLLLKQVAQRVTDCVRETDTVARLGGDEFVILLEGLSERTIEAAAQTEAVGEKILAALNLPYQLAEHEYRSTSSIGAAMLDGHGKNPEELLKQADIAMYEAKKAGRNTLRFFDPKMQNTINARMKLEADLHQALNHRQFQLYYQIQMDSAHHHVGAEALIRWIHPEHGIVSPAEFIPLAEETGLILPIGEWVLQTACAQIKAWERDEQTRHLVLAINVSAKQFYQTDFVAQVRASMQHHAINPQRLKLELTESLLLEDIDDTILTMSKLKEFGVEFSLDDFGTGHSSLQYLKRLPLDQIKIDRSFVRDIATDSSDRAIVSTIIAMAQSLNLDVIAEGVETEDQRQFLLENGCHRYQGFLFSKPLPIEQFEALLKPG